ncbi:nucleotidyltransferase domain-containing protein [Desulfurivibrio sp. C05AmB]|uniref:nucleotidyltransferase domain-containing protein n=1 Tax=Desulfurivibrio sp. C05AmB TaxID=3374371 RepID=UPI00376ECBD6
MKAYNTVDHIILSASIFGEYTSCYSKRVRVVNEIKKYLDSLFDNGKNTILLHGSYSTGIITNFSDIDIVIISSSEKPKKSNDIHCADIARKLSLYIHKIDPLMHHCVDIISDKYFHEYDESVLPVDTLKKSVILKGDPNLYISTNKKLSINNAYNKLINTCNSVLLCNNNLVSRTPYKLKCVISVVLLIPILFIEAIDGIFLYKREALKLFEEKYNKFFPLRALGEASRMREEWKTNCISFAIRRSLFPVENFVRSPLWLQRISGVFFPMNVDDYQDFMRQVQSFANSVKCYAESNFKRL